MRWQRGKPEEAERMGILEVERIGKEEIDEEQRCKLWVHQRLPGLVHIDSKTRSAALEEGSKKVIFDVSWNGWKMDQLARDFPQLRRSTITGLIEKRAVHLLSQP